jgi:hypothetical protein
MANKIAEMIDRADGRIATPCNDRCKYWAFPRLDVACVLSGVYSVPKGRPCYIFEEKPRGAKLEQEERQ